MIQNVRFYHYIICLFWPAAVFFMVGRPMFGVIQSIWQAFIFLIALMIGISTGPGVLVVPFLWFMQSAGEPNLPWVIGAWKRLRLWERGYEYLE